MLDISKKMDEGERKPINVSAEKRYKYHPVNTLLGSDDSKTMREFKQSACKFMGKTSFSDPGDPKKRRHVYNPFTGRVVQQNTKSYYSIKDLFQCPDTEMPESSSATYLQKFETEKAKREKVPVRHGPKQIPLSKRSVLFEAKGNPLDLGLLSVRRTPSRILPSGTRPISPRPAASASAALGEAQSLSRAKRPASVLHPDILRKNKKKAVNQEIIQAQKLQDQEEIQRNNQILRELLAAEKQKGKKKAKTSLPKKASPPKHDIDGIYYTPNAAAAAALGLSPSYTPLNNDAYVDPEIGYGLPVAPDY